MIDIKLEHGQNGYDVVGEYIRKYWEHNVEDTIDLDEPDGFIKVGHVDGITNKRR